MDVAQPLQLDACLMTSNLNILDQYVICLQETVSRILQLTVGRHDFLSAVTASAAPVPCVCRAYVTFGVYKGLEGLLMVILLWVLFTKCHLR